MYTAATRKPAPRKTVLVVDDNFKIRMTLRQLFLADGYELCEEASNGKEAIEVAKECDPDLIVLDLSMPVMNGLEAAPRLKKIVPNAPIILFTLHAGTIQNSDLLARGIAAVISKTDPL
jgi:CheY-like chemotaxis protein